MMNSAFKMMNSAFKMMISAFQNRNRQDSTPPSGFFPGGSSLHNTMVRAQKHLSHKNTCRNLLKRPPANCYLRRSLPDCTKHSSQPDFRGDSLTDCLCLDSAWPGYWGVRRGHRGERAFDAVLMLFLSCFYSVFCPVFVLKMMNLIGPRQPDVLRPGARIHVRDLVLRIAI